MSEIRLKEIISDFDPEKFRDFFREKNSKFSPKKEDFRGYDDENFNNSLKIGDIDFPDDTNMIICAMKTDNSLSERSGKKTQYEKGKKILKDTQSDAGIFIFYDKVGNFRFSLIYANYLGKKRDWSTFKRFTYFVSRKFTNKTFILRIGRGDFTTFENLKEAFSVEKVNKDFYGEIAIMFSELVGGERKVKSKIEKFKHSLKLPGTADHLKLQEFAVRLIGRIVFCWFLKKKKSESGKSLIPENILSSEAAKQNKNYYHSILEKLFFEVLNTRQENRRKFAGHESYRDIPFLNGGLFEPHDEDYYKLSLLNVLSIPDKWFIEFFEILESYNFTIDENTAIDIELSIDPEMLGRIFENLLAEINPETGETARKSTGSYYTPRPIVEYMVDESLKHYLITKTGIAENKITPLLSYSSEEYNISNEESEKIINALDEVKVLDPACGSGAFPIGILQKILLILQKIDRDSQKWLDKKLEKIDNALLKKEMKQKFKDENLDYIRKLGIIQDSIYGVDIQSIAVEISKLRCFLTLIVDESISDKKFNRGVIPLPNLEFKFVAANTLISLPEEEGSLFDESEYIKQLEGLREEYFTSYGQNKLQIESDFINIQEKMVKKLVRNRITGGRAFELAQWNPFFNEKAEWFDPKWMFGIEDGFDIVIGNPPYGLKFNLNEVKFFKRKYISARTEKNKFKGSLDSFSLFSELGAFHIGSEFSVLAFIIPMSFTSSDSMSSLHKIFLKNCESLFISSYFDRPKKVFDSAEQPVTILIALKNNIKTKNLNTTKVIKRYSNESIESIIRNLNFVNSLKHVKYGRIAKVGEEIELSILSKLDSIETKFKNLITDKKNKSKLFYRTSGGRYYKLITNFTTESTKENYFNIDVNYQSNILCGIFSSNLYFWFYHIYSNCRDLKASELLMFPIPYSKFDHESLQKINHLYNDYLKDIEKNSYLKNVTYKNVKSYVEYYPRYSKKIIDKIDLAIQKAYGLTNNEIDFIINYDLKYRIDDDYE